MTTNFMIPSEVMSAFMASFALIGLAEIGDKSQLVCMALASRHRHWPVLLGAAAAFLLLNTLAVTFGAGVAALVPERVTAAVVALLFGAFGVHALFAQGDDASENISELPMRSVFLTTFSLIFLAEFGDKTQLAVAGLASNMAILPVWIGATLALIAISALGVWVGRTLLQRLPTVWLHRVGGAIFLVFAVIAGWRAIG
jgi:putative Ca2+/H+ antiporter (TMEM165/GDT1 family)